MSKIKVEALQSLEHSGTHKQGDQFIVSEKDAEKLVRRKLAKIASVADSDDEDEQDPTPAKKTTAKKAAAKAAAGDTAD